MKKPIIILVLIILVSFIGYKYFVDNKPQIQNTDKSASVEGSSLIKKVYTNTEFKYSINMPDNYKVVDEGKYSVRIMPDVEVLGMGPTNFVYVSVVIPEMKNNLGEIYNYNADQYKKLIEIDKISESVNLAGGDVETLSQWFTYTLTSIEDIDGAKIKNFQNLKPWEFPSGTTENKYIYDTGKNIYILGYYTGGEGIQKDSAIDPRIAYSMIKSFKQID